MIFFAGNSFVFDRLSESLKKHQKVANGRVWRKETCPSRGFETLGFLDGLGEPACLSIPQRDREIDCSYIHNWDTFCSLTIIVDTLWWEQNDTIHV